MTQNDYGQDDSELDDDDVMLQRIILMNFMARQKVQRLGSLKRDTGDRDEDTESARSTILHLSRKFTSK